jgi:acyl-CoA thioesterase FadM
MIRSEDHAVLVEAETEWIFTDAQTGRLRSVPKEVSSLFELVPKEEEPE